ncbi:MAG: hypothetical protein EXS63_03330 [Candidatus Omnitrophica bacterium]|nr:hypothetical protein [Candidatus Omnitrophota bacterium]
MIFLSLGTQCRKKISILWLVLLSFSYAGVLGAAEPAGAKSELKDKLEVSPSIIPLPYQTIKNAGLNRGIHQSFCAGVGMVSDVGQCRSLGCYQEKKVNNRQTNQLPSKVTCYLCVRLMTEENCCPGMSVFADKFQGESCEAKTGLSCSDTRTCKHQCPADSQVVPGTLLNRSVECCKCSTLVSGKCDDKGAERSLTCAEGDISDIRYSAADASDCSNLVIRGGGQCIPKCVGDGVECGAAH